MEPLPRHGGDLLYASQRWKIPESEWLDLSTGINPWAWPVPPVPSSIWQRLPYSDASHLDAAREYFSTEHVLVVPGSQAAIQWLPLLRKHSKVLLPEPGYDEHARQWTKAGHQIGTYHPNDDLKKVLKKYQPDVMVVINPHNPLAVHYSPVLLSDMANELSEKGGWLIIDEAFIDAEPAYSTAHHKDMQGLIILRSTGKFFGLAGLRLGHVIASPAVLDSLQEALGPWSVSGPAQWFGTHMLKDKDWQQKTRITLHDMSLCLADTLALALPGTVIYKAPLFCTIELSWQDALSLYNHLCRHAILTRLIHHHEIGLIRFGACGADQRSRLMEEISNGKL